MAKCQCGRVAVFQDKNTLLSYCTFCSSSELTSSENAYFQFLERSLPLTVGEAVECKREGRYEDGTGIIIDMSHELERGGTPLHPAFLVRLGNGEEKWYTEVCLTRVH